MHKKILLPMLFAAAVVTGVTGSCSGQSGESDKQPSPYVTVRDGEFYIGDSVYRYVGTNFWYGSILASEGEGGDRERLAQELDTLQSIGINNLRILVGGDPQGCAGC